MQYPLHGKISNRPAHKVTLSIDKESGEIALTGWVEETRLHFLKVSMKSTLRMTRGRAGFDIEDEITNISASPAEIQMLYHMNFGQPLLGGGAKVITPIKELVPRNAHAASDINNWNTYTAPKPATEEQVYFATLHANANDETSAMLLSSDESRAAVLGFNNILTPYLTVWKNTTAIEDGYVTGIEPGTNFPNPRSFEGKQGRFIKLDGHQSKTLALSFDYLSNPNDIQAAQTQIEDLQLEEPIIQPSTLPEWCI